MKPTKDQLIQAVESSYNIEDIIEYSDTKLAFVFDGPESLSTIEVHVVPLDEDRHSPGYHLKAIKDESDLAFRLERALAVCFQDNFETIYIHTPLLERVAS